MKSPIILRSHYTIVVYAIVFSHAKNVWLTLTLTYWCGLLTFSDSVSETHKQIANITTTRHRTLSTLTCTCRRCGCVARGGHGTSLGHACSRCRAASRSWPWHSSSDRLQNQASSRSTSQGSSQPLHAHRRTHNHAVTSQKLHSNNCYPLSLSHPAVVTSNVQCVRLAAGRRTQAGDATDQWRDQWNAHISQGSAATHLRCGGIFSDSITTNFLLILTVK